MLHTTRTIWHREMRGFFGRPGGWLTLFAATLPAAAAAGWMAALVSRGGLALRADDDPVSQFLGPNVFLIGTLICLTPLLTMNLIADERRRGSWELLATSPVQATAVVLGKFLAAWSLLSVCLAPWPVFLGMLRLWNGKTRWVGAWLPWFDGPGIEFDPGLLWGGMVGLLIVAGTLSAVGTFASAISRRPVTAAIGTALCLGGLVIASLLPAVLEQWRIPLDRFGWLRPIAVWSHLAEFSRGVVPISRVVMHLSVMTGLVLSAGRLSRQIDG